MTASTEEDANIPAGQDPFHRDSICIGGAGGVLLPWDEGHREELSRRMIPVESWTLEKLVQLKQQLSAATTYDFWQILMEGLTTIMGSQYAFVAKRMLYDDEKAAVEMPPLGETGSCLMGLAFYFKDDKGNGSLFRDYKYHAYQCACGWMRHDRVLLIPDELSKLTPDNPNANLLPIPIEGYMAVPLSRRGKCFAHFGVMWTADGLKNRPKLSWGMLEMFLHALEDLVAGRILEGLSLANSSSERSVIPQSRVSGATMTKHSLQPYARRLSHELRTPMQGVVGMLDVMYASVLEATHPDRWRWPNLNQLKDVIEGLRTSIEVAQDSSKRAVDAADNMVHAYDFNMEVPLTPSREGLINDLVALDDHADIFGFRSSGSSVLGLDDILSQRKHKRRRSSTTSGSNTPRKIPHLEYEDPRAPPAVLEPKLESNALLFPPNDTIPSETSCLGDPGRQTASDNAGLSTSCLSQNTSSGQSVPGTPGLHYDVAGRVTLNYRPLKLRDLLHAAVHESLRTGGRPDFTKITETPRGERVIVEVAETGNSEEERKLVEIEVIVGDDVPENMIIDESYVMKMISSVFHNAFKFTPSGRITLHVFLNASGDLIFSTTDTGEGIPSDFLPDLFKPFSTEDESLTRHRDGLGLGLYVAKGIARKMGGDLWCERTATEGEARGSEFRIRLPINPTDVLGSTPGTLTPSSVNPTTPEPVGYYRHDATTRARPPSPPTKRHSTSHEITNNKPSLSFDPELGKKIPLRILVVEDNRINRALLCSMLHRLGYHDVEEAKDGIEAVEVFAAALPSSPSDTKRAFDLVLMDLWMPRMDGYDAAERIVKLYGEKSAMAAAAAAVRSGGDRGGGGLAGTATGGVTVLAVSADATEEARAKAARKGIHGFVGKPFCIADLGKAVIDFRGKDAFGGDQLSAADVVGN